MNDDEVYAGYTPRLVSRSYFACFYLTSQSARQTGIKTRLMDPKSIRKRIAQLEKKKMDVSLLRLALGDLQRLSLKHQVHSIIAKQRQMKSAKPRLRINWSLHRPDWLPNPHNNKSIQP